MSRKKWGAAAAASAGVCTLWFAYLDRDGCWLYLRGTRGLTAFIFPWLWLLLLFGFKVNGKLALVAFTLVGLLFLPHIDSVAFAAAALRRKYVRLFQKVISPKKTAQWYQVDRRLDILMNMKLLSLLPVVNDSK